MHSTFFFLENIELDENINEIEHDHYPTGVFQDVQRGATCGTHVRVVFSGCDWWFYLPVPSVFFNWPCSSTIRLFIETL